MIYREISLPTGQTLRVIEPSEEYEHITDGDTYASIAYLGDGADVSKWHDTNDEPLEADLTRELYELPPMPPDDEDATEEDYQNQLERLGVYL